MYIYINNQGKITTQIEHGEPVRQGNRLRLVVCFRTDNEIAMNAAGLGVKFRLVDNSEKWSYEYDFPNGHINKFDKLKSSEITYDLIPDEEYLMFESIFDVNEFTTLYNGQLQCVFILRNKNRETIKDYLQDRAEITVNRTYGYILPTTVITPDEKDELMASILSKLDHTGGTANDLTLINAMHVGTQEFRGATVMVKNAEHDYEPTPLQQVVGLINTNNETIIEDKLSEKVDKISGKGLSTNDFTNQYKQKLDRLENYDDTDLKNRIFAVETENTAQGLDISNLESDVSSNKSSLNSLNNEFKIAKQDIVDIKSKNNTQDTEISNINSKNLEQDTEISNIKSKNLEQDTEIYNIKIKDNTQDIEINSIRESLTNVSEEFEDVKKTVADVENSVSGYDSLIENLEQNVSKYDNRITSLENSNKSQDTEISNIKSKNTSQDSEISSIKSKNTSQDTEISNNKKNITTNTNNISSIQSSITNLTSKNASQDTEINTLKGNVQTNTNALKNKADLVNGKIPSSQLPSFVDDVLEYSNKSSFPSTGETGKIYIDLANNTTYRWSGSTYVAIGSSLTLGETSSTAYPGNKGKELADSVANINSKNNSQDTEITNIKSSISTINAKDTAQDNRLTELEDNYENISVSVGTNRADINNLISDLSGIDDIVKTHDETINGLNDNVNNNSTKNQEQDTRLTSLESDVAALKAGGSGGSEDLSEVLNDIADLQELTNKHDTHIADLEGTVTTIQQSDAQQNQAIQNVVNQLGQVSNNLYLLDSDVKDLTERTDIIEEDVNNVKTEINRIDDIDAKTNDLQRNKADRLSGQIINDKFYTRVTASDSTNSKYEIIEDMGSIQKIGGMSYVSDNLLVFDDITSTTINGITYSVKNGVVTLNGKSTATSTFYLNLPLSKLINAGTYSYNSFFTGTRKVFQARKDGSYVGNIGYSGNDVISNLSISGDFNQIWIPVEAGENVNGLSYSPMLVNGSTAPTEFEQGFSDLRDTKVAALTSTGDNLLVFDDIPETTKNGITYSVKDGVFYYTGTASARVDINVNLKTKLILNGTYWFALFNNTVDNCSFRFFDGYTLVRGLGHTMINQGYAITWNNQPITSLNLMIESGKSMTNATVSPMIIVGSTKPAQFEQGWMDMITIPTEIQQLDGYGVGIDDEYYNYVDFQNKKFVKQVQKLVLDGSIDETYNLSTADNGNGIANFNITFSSLGLPKFITNGITYYYIANREKQNTLQSAITTEGVYLNQENLFIRVNSSTANTIASLRTYLSNNPVEVAYVIENPIETDLSHLKLDSVYRVSNMGSETLENEYKQKAPSEILYGVDIVPQVIENASNISLIRETMKEFAYQDDVNDLQQEIVNKVDKTKGEIVEESFYSRPTGSHFEITDETGSIMKLGGMSYKSSNLLVFDDVERTVLSGITYRVDNGVIYLTGTATAAASIKFPLSGVGSGSYYFKWEFTGTTSSGVFGYLYSVGHTSQLTLLNTTSVFHRPVTLTQEAGDFTVYWQSGAVISNLALKPILVKGSTEPTIWEKGFKGIQNAKVTAISSVGKNLINDSKLNPGDGTAKRQSDGSFISKVLSQYQTIFLNSVYVSSIGGNRSSNGFVLKQGTYYASLKAKLNSGTMGTINAIFIDKENTARPTSTWITKPTLTSGYQTYKVKFTLDTDDVVGFSIQADYYASNAVIQFKDIMISSVDTDFEPYWEDVTEIPQEIQDLDSYGCGINEECYNYVDFQNKKYVQMVGSYTFTGGEGIGQANTNTSGVYRYFTEVLKNLAVGVNASNVKGALLMADLNTATADETYLKNDGVCIDSNGRLYFFKSDIQSTTDMANYLKGKTIYFALATPTETDISDIKLNQVYRVDNNGMETLVNEYKLSAPTEILYGVNITPQVIENSNDIASIKDELKLIVAELNDKIYNEINLALQEDY